MPSALVPLANITVGSGITSVTFSSISQSYRDLMLVISNVTASSSVTYTAVQLNSDTGGNYHGVYMLGNGSSAVSSDNASQSTMWIPGGGSWSTSSKGQVLFHLMDYSATDKHKSALVRTDDAGQFTIATAWRWANTSAVTTLQVNTGGQPAWASGANFALYGIASA